MDQWNYESIVNIAAALVSIAAGLGGVPYLTQRLKAELKVSGKKAWILTVAVSLLAAIVTEVARGAINPDSFNPVNVGSLLALVVGASQVTYQDIKRRDDDDVDGVSNATV